MQTGLWCVTLGHAYRGFSYTRLGIERVPLLYCALNLSIDALRAGQVGVVGRNSSLVGDPVGSYHPPIRGTRQGRPLGGVLRRQQVCQFLVHVGWMRGHDHG